MSVLIKGMEMPYTCENCNFHIYHGNGEYACVATPMFYPMNLANSKGMRKDWCPLTEVPTPTIEPETEEEAYERGYTAGQMAERKKGKWIDETFKPWGLAHYPYKCDQCGEHNEADSNFCPNCGADMRGKGEHT